MVVLVEQFFGKIVVFCLLRVAASLLMILFEFRISDFLDSKRVTINVTQTRLLRKRENLHSSCNGYTYNFV